jgi:hypothetical protein
MTSFFRRLVSSSDHGLVISLRISLLHSGLDDAMSGTGPDPRSLPIQPSRCLLKNRDSQISFRQTMPRDARLCAAGAALAGRELFDSRVTGCGTGAPASSRCIASAAKQRSISATSLWVGIAMVAGPCRSARVRSGNEDCTEERPFRGALSTRFSRAGGTMPPGKRGWPPHVRWPACLQLYGRGAVTRQIVLDRSSATSSPPRPSTVTPTGRPRVLPSSPMKPVTKSTGGPAGRPLLNGTKETL